MLTRVSSVCVFTNGVTFCYNILCWVKLANRLFKTYHMLCSVATTKCGSLWPQDKWFMISKWECYHLLYRWSWIRSVIDQLTQGRPRCTSGLFKISCVPFSVRKNNFWVDKGRPMIFYATNGCPNIYKLSFGLLYILKQLTVVQKLRFPNWKSDTNLFQ